MKRYKLTLLVVWVFVSSLVVPMVVSAGASDMKSGTEKQDIVVHLSNFTNDLHASFMAFKLGTALENQNANVTVFLDLEGVRVADKKQPQTLIWGPGGTSDFAAVYDAFIKAGGKVLVCPHCAKSAGVSESDLRDGAKLGTIQEISKLLLSADKVLDY